MQIKNLLRLAVVASLVAAAIFITPAQSANAAGAGDFLGRINGLRASKGLGALTIDSRLSGIAQSWAQTMASKNAISHNPALGSIPGDWTKVGENVGTGGDVESIFNALVASPGHYKNMVEGSFNSIGIGIATGSDGRLYTTHDFAAYPGASSGTKANASATPSKPAPAPKPTAITKKNTQPKPAAPAVALPVPAAPASPPTTVPEAPKPEPPAPVQAAPVPSAQIVQGYTELADIARQG